MWFSVTILNGNSLSHSGFLHRSHFFSFSFLGIYDLTGFNRQHKAIHHAGLMWESKFNLVSLIYKYWPFGEHTECVYLSVKSCLPTMSNKFLGSEVQGRVSLGDREQ